MWQQSAFPRRGRRPPAPPRRGAARPSPALPAAGAIFRHSASGCCHLVPLTGLRPGGHRRSGGDGSKSPPNPGASGDVLGAARPSPPADARPVIDTPRGGGWTDGRTGRAPVGAAGSEAALPRARGPNGHPGPNGGRPGPCAAPSDWRPGGGKTGVPSAASAVRPPRGSVAGRARCGRRWRGAVSPHGAARRYPAEGCQRPSRRVLFVAFSVWRRGLGFFVCWILLLLGCF